MNFLSSQLSFDNLIGYIGYTYAFLGSLRSFTKIEYAWARSLWKLIWKLWSYWFQKYSFGYSILNSIQSSKIFSSVGGINDGIEAIMEKGDTYQYHCPYEHNSSHWLNPSDKYKGSYFQIDSKYWTFYYSDKEFGT